jgi:hypothetical protein
MENNVYDSDDYNTDNELNNINHENIMVLKNMIRENNNRVYNINNINNMNECCEDDEEDEEDDEEDDMDLYEYMKTGRIVDNIKTD